MRGLDAAAACVRERSENQGFLELTRELVDDTDLSAIEP